MSKLKRLFVNNALFTVLGGNVAASILGLLIFTFLARGLGATEFGLWVIFTTATSTMDLIRTGWVKQGFIRTVETSSELDKETIIGSAWLLCMIVSIISALVIYLLALGFGSLVSEIQMELFFSYFPIYVLVSAPYYMASWSLQAIKNFRVMNRLRLAVNSMLLLLVATNTYWGFNSEGFVITFVWIHGLVSLAVLFNKQYGISTVRYYHLSTIKTLVRFGKNSLATLAGGSLLKGTDIYLIGWLIGPQAVALYSIPMKLMDLLDIPLRSLMMAEFPKLTRLFKEGRKDDFQEHLYKLIGWGSLVALPVILGLLVLSNQVLTFLGATDLYTGRWLLVIFSVAMVIMPLEKFMGIAFDAINRPDRNALKVWIMLLANLVGDLVVIYFMDSIIAVACITVLNLLVGIAYSIRLFSYHPVKPTILYQYSIREAVIIYQKMRLTIRPVK